MKEEQFIPVTVLCSQYSVEFSFIDELQNIGLIEIQIIEQNHFIHADQLAHLEKIMRLHQELKVNLEGIDVVMNLLEKERQLRDELTALKNRLRVYEND